MFNSLKEKIIHLTNKFSKNIFILSLNEGLGMIIPFTIIGSIFTLIDNFPVASIYNYIHSTNLGSLLSLPSRFTIDMISLYSAFTIAFAYGRNRQKQNFTLPLLSVFCFLLLTPLYSQVDNGKEILSISFEWLGAKGLFVSIFTAFLSSKTYFFIIEKKMTITMPKEVPDVVAESFISLIPCFMTTIIFLILKFIFIQTPYNSLHEYIYLILQIPLTNLGSNLLAICIFTLLTTLLWWFGIHGGQIVGAFTSPIFIPLAMENLSAFNNGGDLPHIYTASFNGIYLFGGSGMTLALCIILILFCKNPEKKTLGKLTFIPNIFNINEPLLFGLPIILNPIMFIPFIITPLVSVIIAYYATTIELVPKLISYQLPWTMPPFINGYLQGGVKVALLQVFLFIISFFIYLPFVKLMTMKQKKESSI